MPPCGPPIACTTSIGCQPDVVDARRLPDRRRQAHLPEHLESGQDPSPSGQRNVQVFNTQKLVKGVLKGASMRQFVVSNDGTRIAYETSGIGGAALIVLGALNSRKSGTKLAKLLSSKLTAVSYDRRGRGDSSDSTPYSPEREVEDIAAIIDAVGAPVCLYGHSSGAGLAITAAVKLGRRVRKLAIYEAPYALDGTARKAAEDHYLALKESLSSGHNGDAVALFVRSVGVSEAQVQAMRRLPMWKGLEKLAPTLVYDSEVLGEGHSLPSALLSRVRTPTLVMHGGAGSPQMREAARAISEAIPGAELRSLARQTHGVSPRVIAPVLEEFFA
jgi:pimeloyl-ACP methyl ester carboxylesterase